ncbi:MAG: hypothetical protein ABWZ02_09375 [Nakamurella sp.]
MKIEHDDLVSDHLVLAGSVPDPRSCATRPAKVAASNSDATWTMYPEPQPIGTLGPPIGSTETVVVGAGATVWTGAGTTTVTVAAGAADAVVVPTALGCCWPLEVAGLTGGAAVLGIPLPMTAWSAVLSDHG